VLSGRGLCDELITRPEESYRLCCVVVCDLETSRIGAPYMYDIRTLRVKDWRSFTPILHVLLHRVLVKTEPVWPLFMARRQSITAAPVPMSISLPPTLCGACGGQCMSCTAAPPYAQTIWLTMSVPPFLIRPPTSQPVTRLIQNNSPLSSNRKLISVTNLKLCQWWLWELLYHGARRRVVL